MKKITLYDLDASSKIIIKKFFTISQKTCPDCNGTGYDFGDGGQCDTCDGLGYI